MKIFLFVSIYALSTEMNVHVLNNEYGTLRAGVSKHYRHYTLPCCCMVQARSQRVDLVEYLSRQGWKNFHAPSEQSTGSLPLPLPLPSGRLKLCSSAYENEDTCSISMEKMKNFLGRATLLPTSTTSTRSMSCFPGNKMLASGYTHLCYCKKR